MFSFQLNDFEANRNLAKDKVGVASGGSDDARDKVEGLEKELALCRQRAKRAEEELEEAENKVGERLICWEECWLR